MIHSIIALSLLLPLAVSAADTRLAFTGQPKAQTSVGQPAVILSGAQPTGMQILYKKLVSDNRLAPLVTVYLYHAATGTHITLQEGFDTIAQACSCYWIDANDLAVRFSKSGIFASQSWALRFMGGNMDVISGEFGVGWNNELVEGQLAKDVVKQQAPAPVMVLPPSSPSAPGNNGSSERGSGGGALLTSDKSGDASGNKQPSIMSPKSTGAIMQHSSMAALFLVITGAMLMV